MARREFLTKIYTANDWIIVNPGELGLNPSLYLGYTDVVTFPYEIDPNGVFVGVQSYSFGYNNGFSMQGSGVNELGWGVNYTIVGPGNRNLALMPFLKLTDGGSSQISDKSGYLCLSIIAEYLN